MNIDRAYGKMKLLRKECFDRAFDVDTNESEQHYYQGYHTAIIDCMAMIDMDRIDKYKTVDDRIDAANELSWRRGNNDQST